MNAPGIKIRAGGLASWLQAAEGVPSARADLLQAFFLYGRPG